MYQNDLVYTTNRRFVEEYYELSYKDEFIVSISIVIVVLLVFNEIFRYFLVKRWIKWDGQTDTAKDYSLEVDGFPGQSEVDLDQVKQLLLLKLGGVREETEEKVRIKVTE